MKLLVFGGTKFLGRGVVESAGAHDVTLVNRGRTNPELYPDLERIELEIWWKFGADRRRFNLEGFRMNIVKPGEFAPGVTQ